ncbi:LGFP repeat-containing protein [Dactylosporangium sp. CA-092794]|uniref:LGFP repeat-containing protein n=1 Tax=Dactylosporangium sp. CA-092794 TaxID=3239929 RepID=UPI003D8DFA87
MSDHSHLHGGLGAHLPPGTGDPLSAFVEPAFAAARDAIAAKAAALPFDTGARVGNLESGPGVFADERVFHQRYEHCTIYFGPRTGAHEIHGGIRDKYDSARGPELLGIPVTDESPCADGTGRYNHFDKDGSIFWHPDTGPFWINGALRDEWRRRNWEQGPHGYPLRDQFGPVPGQSVVLFQAGALCFDGSRVTDAPSATLGREPLLTYVWRTFERLMRESPDNVGLYPDRSIDAVSHSYGDFVRARNRVVTFTINGFHDAGLLLPDQHWSAHLQLLIQEIDAAQAGGHDIGVSEVHIEVQADGVGAPILARTLSAAIARALPLRVAAPAGGAQATFPPESGLIGVVVGPDASVTLLFCDTATGRIAAEIARRRIEALLD